jgi:hypothetical protein
MASWALLAKNIVIFKNSFFQAFVGKAINIRQCRRSYVSRSGRCPCRYAWFYVMVCYCGDSPRFGHLDLLGIYVAKFIGVDLRQRGQWQRNDDEFGCDFGENFETLGSL